MEIRKGMLVYVPSGVRLYRSTRDSREYELYVEDYVVTEKPINCLVVEATRAKAKHKPYYSVIYEGRTWQVAANAVYQVEKEKTNVSYSG